VKITTRIICALFLSGFLVACRFGAPAAEAVTVTITSPANNAVVPMGIPVQVNVTANAPAGVARVELNVNGILVAVSNNDSGSNQYQAVINYTPLSTGPYNLIARAYDKNNTASAPAGLALQAVVQGQATAATAQETPAAASPTQTAQVTPTTVPGIPGPGGCVLNAQFIADVTMPDGTIIPLGGAFSKTWRVRNTGTCTWDNAYKLVFAAGSQMNAAGSVALNTTNPGDITDITVPMQAPGNGTGTLSGEWRFAAPDNTIFGNKLTVVIALPAPTATVQPTIAPATATPTPTITFSADNTAIVKGGCAKLSWSTNNVSGVFLDNIGVPSPSDKQVCPTETTTYTLKVNLNDGTNTSKQIMVSVSSGTVIYSFADNAISAHWTNEVADNLSFGGPDIDNRGFAMKRDGSTLEDNSLQLKVIETHPHWVANGSITGDYDVSTTLQAGDRFLTKVGFLQGAANGSVTLRLLFKGAVIGEISKSYDGALKEWNIDLSSYAGQSGKFSLQVLGAPSTNQAWMCWVNPRIEQ
jgi:Ig-like domain from next to BRCA1 gene/Bacterial Ig domain